MISALTGDGVDDLKRWLAARVPRARGTIPRTRSPTRRCASSPPRSPARSCSCGCTRNCPTSRRSRPRAGRSCKDGSVRIEQTIYRRAREPAQDRARQGRRRPSRRSAPRRARNRRDRRAPVHLFLFVKVRENWADDPERYREMGLEFPQGLSSRADGDAWNGPTRASCSARRHGEASVILELMTASHGRHLGLVRGGAGSRAAAGPAAGQPRQRDLARAARRASRQLRASKALQLRAASAVLAVAHAVYGVTHLGALCRLLPERDPHPRNLFERSTACSTHARRSPHAGGAADRALRAGDCWPNSASGSICRHCAATGATTISSMSRRNPAARCRARRASRGSDRLLRLPAFLRDAARRRRRRAEDLADGFALTGFFLLRHVLEPRGLALPTRARSFIAAVLREALRACRRRVAAPCGSMQTAGG